MTKAEFETAMAKSSGRGYSDAEANYRIILRDGYIQSLEYENARLEKLFDKACEIITELNGVACADWKAWIEKTVAKEAK